MASDQTKVWLLYWGQMVLFTCRLTSGIGSMAGLLFSGTLEDFTNTVQAEINNAAHFQGHQTAGACLLDKYMSTLGPAPSDPAFLSISAADNDLQLSAV